jgi:hypothetical protein
VAAIATEHSVDCRLCLEYGHYWPPHGRFCACCGMQRICQA